MHITAEINPPFIIINRRHSGNQAAVALHRQRKFGNIVNKIIIRRDLQIMLINIRSRHAVDLCHTGIAHHFRDFELLAYRLPAQHIIAHYLQIFPAKGRHENAAFIELTARN